MSRDITVVPEGDLNPHALAGTSPSSFPPGTLANWHKPIWLINKGFCLLRSFTVDSGRAIIADNPAPDSSRAAPKSEHRATLFATLFEPFGVANARTASKLPYRGRAELRLCSACATRRLAASTALRAWAALTGAGSYSAGVLSGRSWRR